MIITSERPWKRGIKLGRPDPKGDRAMKPGWTATASWRLSHRGQVISHKREIERRARQTMTKLFKARGFKWRDGSWWCENFLGVDHEQCSAGDAAPIPAQNGEVAAGRRDA